MDEKWNSYFWCYWKYLYNFKGEKIDQDDYTVKVSYPKGFILSQKAYITVEGIALKIVKNLTYQTAIEGDQVQIPILVNGGTGKYLYSWYKNNELIKSTNYPYYIMSSVSKTEEGFYHVIIFDGNQELTSSKMFLTVKERSRRKTLTKNLMK